MKTKLIYSLMFAQTNSEVNEIVNTNIDYLNENPDLWKFVRNCRKRIHTIRREKRNSWKLQLN